MDKILSAWLFISIILFIAFIEEKQANNMLAIVDRDGKLPDDRESLLADFVDFNAQAIEQV